MPKRVAILQSNYIPWKGYFDLIHDVDELVFLDDVQYTRQNWRNRNRVKTDRGAAWLTIPVGTSLDRRICDVTLPDGWAEPHWRQLQQWYSHAPHFETYRPVFEDLYLARRWTLLSDLNQQLIRTIAGLLGITTRFRDSRELDVATRNQDRVLDILGKVGAEVYVSGPAARAYLEPQRFADAGIELVWKDYAGYPEYPQFHPPFVHDVTILDLLFHTGPRAPWYIWGWRTEAQIPVPSPLRGEGRVRGGSRATLPSRAAPHPGPLPGGERGLGVRLDDALFITGAQRSGTTLLEKLIGALPGVSVLSQPFPLLFVAVKREFLQSLGVEDVAYPLGHLFREDRYERSAFAEFLAQWRTSPAALRAIFEEMRDYSGQYTKFEREQLERAFAEIAEGDDFAAVVRKLNRSLRAEESASFFGSKETTCEEFLPSFLSRGVRCTLIVRDPRDILASLNHGRGATFAGSPKPTLFNIRSWRKSVAHALALEEHARFQWCRYEDLVRDPEGVLRRMAAGLGLPEPVRTELGDWRGNSSHTELQGISESPVGNYRNLLAPEVQQLVEAACLPELKALGYETSLTIGDAIELLRLAREPYTITREGMQGDRAGAHNAELEIERLSRVASADSAEWFLFERAHARLREAMRS